MDIKNLVAQMTLEEKASLCSGSNFWHTKAIERLGIPRVMVSDGPHGLRKQDAKSDHLGINDSIPAVCFPAACATAASFDRNVVRQLGEAMGDTCQHEEVSVILGPGMNIKRSPLCGRNFEYFSEDPHLTGEMAISYTDGVQSKHIGTSLKHFAANNQEHRRMSSSSQVDERTMREIYLSAFEATVKRAKPWTVMCSYNRINGVYAAEDPLYLTQILRDEWGFDGYVVSDWGATNDRAKGVAAGLDLEMPFSGGENDRLIVQAVKDGKIPESAVDKAAQRNLTINYRYLENAKPETLWDKDAHHALARKLASQCMVLLKNDESILPLTQGDDIAIIGEFAVKPRFQGGGSSHINCFKTTSLMDALDGVPGITYTKGYEIAKDEADEEQIAQAVKAAQKAKVAVIVAGLPDVYESEGYDRSHMHMPPCQELLIDRVAEANPNTIVVLYNGSPIEMPWLHKVKAVVEAYLGGQAVGGATADILFGKENPSGRLPETFPLKMEHNPSYLSYGGEGDRVDYQEGIFVGYRYYDTKQMDVLFPFGYGLSYTSFDYSNLTLGQDAILDTESVHVSVTVTNTGKCFGQEVVQLYVADKQKGIIRPSHELKAFDKVALAPGESKVVTFTLDKRAFAYWNTTIHNWHVQTGAFALQIGRNSRDIVLEKEITVTSTVKIKQTFTVNSVLYDLMQSDKAKEKLLPMLQTMAAALGTGADPDAAESIISPTMLQAMLNNMPLRTIMSFAGKVSYAEMNALIDSLNE